MMDEDAVIERVVFLAKERGSPVKVLTGSFDGGAVGVAVKWPNGMRSAFRCRDEKVMTDLKQKIAERWGL